MSDRPDLDRLLEAYAVRDIEPHARRVAEDVLAGRHEHMNAEEAQEILRFERSLVSALDTPAGDDVADRVLDRLYRRPETGARREFRRDLAAATVSDAVNAGRVTKTHPRRRYYFERPGFVRAAGFLVVLGGLMFMSLRDYWRTTVQAPRNYVIQAPAVEPIANLAFVSDTKAEPETLASPASTDAIYAGAMIETRPDQRAVITLPEEAGRIIVHPDSRVRLLRQLGTKQTRLLIEQGGVWADLSGHQPLLVQAGANYGGQLRGRGEVVLASRTLGTSREIVSPALGRSLVVSVEGEGRAVFRNGNEEIAIRGDEMGVVGETAVVKMPRGSKAAVRIPVRDWPLGEAIEEPNGEAIRLGGQVFTREAVIREAMRVYGPDFIDLQVRSVVIQRELERRGLKIAPVLRDLARRHVWQDEMMQVAPLRSAGALEERVYQVSGLLALAYGGSEAQLRDPRRIAVSTQFCESMWARLAPRVRIEWPLRDDERFALRLRFDEEIVAELDLAEAWSTLRHLLRPAEVERLMDDMVETWVVRSWLESKGGRWPEANWSEEADSRRRAAQELLVRMSGISPLQFLSRMSMQRVALAYEPAPAAAEVERLIEEELSSVERVAFEHFIFPFALTGGDDAEGRARARRLAEAAVSTLREGPEHYPPPVKGADELPSIWRTGPCYGPRPWWDEIYGEAFGETVLNLAAGEVSDVIPGREAFHVVRMKRLVSSMEDPLSRHRRARQTLMMQSVRRRVDRLLDRVAMTRVSGHALLR